MSLFPAGTATWGPPGDASSPWRYTLTRRWSDGPTMAVIGVNPSTATAEQDDPTIRRCIRFARDSGHGSLTMLNLFAYRATDIADLVKAAASGVDVVGAQNDGAILVEALTGATVVCAWGPPAKVPPSLRARFGEVPAVLLSHEVPLHVFAATKDGSPAHPLYLPASCRPVRWAP